MVTPEGRALFLSACTPRVTPRQRVVPSFESQRQRSGTFGALQKQCSGTLSVIWRQCSGTVSATHTQRSGPFSTNHKQPQQQTQPLSPLAPSRRYNSEVIGLVGDNELQLQQQTQPLSLPAPTPRYNSEVLGLVGDSEHAIRERWREIERQRQRALINVRTYLEDCWDRVGFHTADADSARLEKALQRQHSNEVEATVPVRRCPAAEPGRLARSGVCR